MDVNRPFGDGVDSDGNGIVDEPTQQEVTNEGLGVADGPYVSESDKKWGLTNGRDANNDKKIDLADQLVARSLYARHLYCLARLVLPSGAATPAEIAQWAVNVVDFRDPDSIITEFNYDPNFPYPSADDAAKWQPPSNCTCWGTERPELLLTEAIAWNNVKEAGSSPGPFTYTDSNSGGFLLELYHPWTGIATTSSGTIRCNPLPAEFLAANTGSGFSLNSEIDLTRAANNTDPVFQIAVIEDSGTIDTTLRDNPAFANKPGSNDDLAVVIYPWSQTDAQPDTAKLPRAKSAANTFYTAANAGLDAENKITPGQFAIMGGGKKLGDSPSTFIAEIGSSTTLDPSTQSGVVLGPTSASWLAVNGVGESLSGYVAANRQQNAAKYPNDWRAGKPAAEQPGPLGAVLVADKNSSSSAVLRLPLVFNGTQPTPKIYRVLLRRLANPLLPFNSNSNPYVTIDSISVQQKVVIENASGSTAALRLTATQRGWARRTQAEDAWDANNIWTSSNGDLPALDGPLYPGLDRNCGPKPTSIDWTFGFLTPGLRMAKPSGDSTSVPFPWLPWLNREFASVQELLLVPKSGPATLLRDFSTIDPSNSTGSWFKHLFLDPEAPQTTPPGRPSRDRLKLLDYLAVRSRFADSAEYIPGNLANQIRDAANTPLFYPPHNYLTDTRQAGRVNLNTIASAEVWDAVNGGRPSCAFRDEGHVENSAFVFSKSEDYSGGFADGDRRNGNWTLDTGEDANADTRLNRNDDLDNDNAKDDRDGTLVGSRRGDSATTSTPAPAGDFDLLFMRKTGATDFFEKPFALGDTLHRVASNGRLLFEAPANLKPYNSRQRNPWFRYESVIGLGPTTTIRSNVYAVWITVGFFRTNDAGTTLGEEHDVDRVRYFAIIDRSIPNAFSPAQNLGCDRVIMIKRMIP
jgi:hypothetical protein